MKYRKLFRYGGEKKTVDWPPRWYGNLSSCDGSPPKTVWIEKGSSYYTNYTSSAYIYYSCHGMTYTYRFYYYYYDIWPFVAGVSKDCYTFFEINPADCKAGDTLLAEFIPIEQCYNGLTGTYAACAQNCLNPEDKALEDVKEICSNGIDDNCNGEIDDGCSFCVDNDRDGSYAISWMCPEGNDCNDGDFFINPFRIERCDNKDNNCNAETDEGLCCAGCCDTNTPCGSFANYYSGNFFDTFGINLISSVTLYYNSFDTYANSLGRGWTHSYNQSIAPVKDGVLLHIAGGGRRVYYYRGTDGLYRASPQTGIYSHIESRDTDYILTEKDGTRYSFNTQGRLISINEHNGKTTTLSYDSGNNLSSITDSDNRTLAVTSAGGKITAINSSAGNYSFTYIDGLLSTITDPLGNAWRFTYNGGLLETGSDPEGNVTRYSYDSEGRIAATTDSQGGVTSISYDPDNSTARITQKDGGVWTYFYDIEKSAPLEIIDPEGNRTTYTYDDHANLLTETLPDGSVTSYAYDDRGNVLTVADADGNVTSYTYNEYSQITSVTDNDGNAAAYEYDERGNLISITDPEGETTRYEYDERSNVIIITNPDGQTTRFTYDVNNNMTSITDPTGATTTFTYDANGNMTSAIDAAGAIIRYEYNSLNQLIKTIDPLGNVTVYSYDANGNRTFETDANGNTTRYEYDYRGNLIKVTDALGNVTKYIYGAGGCPSCGGEGNLASIIDANGNTTAYAYDTLGRLVKETNPLGNSIAYSYDSRGRLISKIDAEGNKINYAYDSIGRLVKKTYPDNSAKTFTYDSKGNIINAANQHIAYTFIYDANSRVASVTDSNNRKIIYEYDAMDRKVRMAAPDGSIVNYNYDNAGRLAKITPSPPTHSPSGFPGEGWGEGFIFAYDNLGRRAKLTHPNGITTLYTYDTAGRLTNIAHKDSSNSMIATNSYTHDKVGNRLTNTTPERTLAYQYDAIYRLKDALSSTPGWSSNTKAKGKGIVNATQQQKEFYTYDPVDNRLASHHNRSYAYNSDNQLTLSLRAEGEAISYQYDRNGNLIKKVNNSEVTTYFYDYENRLTKVTMPDGTLIEFKYDPFGKRIEKKITPAAIDEIEASLTSSPTVGETTSTSPSPPSGGEGWGEGVNVTRYLYDSEDILFEYDESGKITNRYIHGQGVDEPLSMTNDKGTYFYHADGLGSIVALTDFAGKTVQTYEYDSFGNLKDQKNRIKQPYTFTAREWDKETGLYYYRARYYDPAIGRFITQDPIGFEGGDVNLYGYVNGNPINETDPYGLVSYATPVSRESFNSRRMNSPLPRRFSVAPSTNFGGPSMSNNYCCGTWQMMGWNRFISYSCVCYWLCVPCDRSFIWGGNYMTLPSTIGQVFTQGGDIKRGDTCLCRTPGAQSGCRM